MEREALPFADHDLARRIEGAEAEAAINYSRILGTFMPQAAMGFERVAGGVAVFAGKVRASRAFALGMNGAVEEDDITRVETFYRNRKAPILIEVCPLAHGSLIEVLARRGYRVTDFSNVWIRALTPHERFSMAKGVAEPSIVSGDDIDPWAATVSRGFSESLEVSDESMVLGRATCAVPGVTCFLARLDGEPAAAAAMIQQAKLATFFATSTLPHARGRGLHTALLQARLAHAAGAGCDLAMVITAPGSRSQRNIERAHFRLAYTKVEMTRAET